MTPANPTRTHLLAYIYFAFADIDFQATEQEMEAVIQRIKSWLGEDDEQANQILRDSFEWYFSARSENKIPKQINDHQALIDQFSAVEKEKILDELTEIAYMDGEINEAENNFIQALKILLSDEGGS